MGAKHAFRSGSLSLIAIFTKHEFPGLPADIAADILDGNDKNLLSKLITKYISTGQYEEAFEAGSRYADQCDGDFAVISQFAYSAHLLGRKETAAEYARKALALNPDSRICASILDNGR